MMCGAEHNTSDAAFRRLCTDTRRLFEAHNFPLTVETLLGKVSLKPRPA